jgi:multiple antibiotic resistance protein
MIDEALRFFIVLFVVVEPITLVPFFSGLTQGASESWRRRMACKSVMIAGGILAVFALGGSAFIRAMGIGIDAFRIGGGIMLFLMALEMVFARESGTRQTSGEAVESRQRTDISVFPLAFPFIAGPGALAVTLLTFGAIHDDWVLKLALLGVVLVVLAIALIVMLLTPPIMRVLGLTGANVVNRLAGVVLATLAVQFVIDGVKGAFALD